MTYQIVFEIEGQLIADKTPDVIAYMSARGVKLTGYNTNPRQRIELQNQPKFEGYCGPMWNGDSIRYESIEAYRRLSA
jgi:hypothetical protein